MKRLVELLTMYCVANDTSLRNLAKEFDVSPSTFTRMGQGYPCDAQTLVRIINWLTEVDPNTGQEDGK